jgi:cytochrome c oxidase assembly factor CtaG
MRDIFGGEVSAWLSSLGPWAPSLAIFLGGCLFISGFIFNWKWIYPKFNPGKKSAPETRRGLLLLTGIILIIISLMCYLSGDFF